MVLIFSTLVGAGAVPPLIGFLADTVSFSFAFSAAGAATLAFLVFLGCFPARGVTPSDGDEGTRAASR
jgi:fucose permease